MKYLLIIMLTVVCSTLFGQTYTYKVTQAGSDSKYELRIYKNFAHWQEIQKPVANGKGYFITTSLDNYEYDELYKDKKNKTIYTKRRIGNKPQVKYYNLVDDFNMFNWKLVNNETIKILGYECKMATTTFRGRNYTAYYTPKIKLQEGPFKFNGLPGMILKIENDDKQEPYSWECIAINPKKTKRKIVEKQNAIFKEFVEQYDPINWEEYKQKFQQHLNEYVAEAKKEFKGSKIWGINAPEIYHKQYQTKGIIL